MIGKEVLNYTIISLIGQGGMGSVYLAEHKYIKQQKVAIKVINKDMVNDFTREKLKEEPVITIAQVRDMFQTSRKSAKPILEYMDTVKVTRKTGAESERVAY